MSPTMRAVVAHGARQADDPESLVDRIVDAPTARGRDLLVAVRAIAMNPVDTKVRRTLSPADGPRILGWDAAGVVTSVGEDVRGFAPGDEVMFAGAIDRPGANAEYVLVDERIVAHKPRRASFAEAAAMPLTSLTAYEAFFERMRIPFGESSRGRSLLIVGAAGGVGSIAVQIAKAWTGTTVLGTASREASRDHVLALGADHVIDARGDLRAQLAGLGHDGVDYVFCTADTDPYVAPLVDLVAPQGVVGFIVPPTRPMDLGPLHAKSASVAWELMFTRTRYSTADLAEQGLILDRIRAALDEGILRSTATTVEGPIDARTLRLAHAHQESGRAIGKAVFEGW